MGLGQNKPTPCLDLGQEWRVIPTPGVPCRISWGPHSSVPHRLQTSFPRAVLGEPSTCRSLGLRSVPSGTRCKTSIHYVLYFGDSPVKEVSDLKWFSFCEDGVSKGIAGAWKTVKPVKYMTKEEEKEKRLLSALPKMVVVRHSSWM